MLLYIATSYHLCGNFTVYSQMDYHLSGKVIYPQIQRLDELYAAAPNATWVLQFRNISNWVNSINHWNSDGRVSRTYRNRFNSATLPQLNWTKEMGMNDSDYEMLFCRHVRHLRQFVSERPSLSLVEYSIEDPDTGAFLASVFDRVDASLWKMENVNKKIPEMGQTVDLVLGKPPEQRNRQDPGTESEVGT